MNEYNLLKSISFIKHMIEQEIIYQAYLKNSSNYLQAAFDEANIVFNKEFKNISIKND